MGLLLGMLLLKAVQKLLLGHLASAATAAREARQVLGGALELLHAVQAGDRGSAATKHNSITFISQILTTFLGF